MVFYLFLFREREREEGEGEKHQCVRDILTVASQPTTQACALTGNRTRDLSVLRLALNQLSHTSQGTW